VSDVSPVYDAFISYRRSDGTRAARRLRQMLNAYRLPKGLKAGRPGRLNIFLDTVYERGASDFYEKTIVPALKASRYLLVVATPDAVQRPKGDDWIAREVADFSAGENSGNVIVVRALGEFTDRLPADIGERYPHVQVVDMRDHSWLSHLMPQRAVRLADEKLKIVAPLFDVALEDMPLLKREEERQQMRRLGSASGGTIAVVVAVAGLSLYALQSQWQGQQALIQSLRVIQDAIYGLIEQYSADEALRSPSRELVLQSCDVANRLATLSGQAVLPEVDLACSVEEGLAIGISNRFEDGSRRIESAIAAGRATYDKQPINQDRLLKTLQKEHATWLTFERI
jgi:hypothetical protein